MKHAMDLTSLLGSRICHDLISPLGAIGNGVELLNMSGAPKSPEMSLISESVENATARIRLFRVAFGAAPPGQAISRNELAEVLTGLTRGGRLSIVWQAEGDVPRQEVKLAFLCILCLESAIPWGGKITVTRQGDGWLLTAEAPKLRDMNGLWTTFATGETHGTIAAAEIEFLLAPNWAATAGFRLQREQGPNRIQIACIAA